MEPGQEYPGMTRGKNGKNNEEDVEVHEELENRKSPRSPKSIKTRILRSGKQSVDDLCLGLGFGLGTGTRKKTGTAIGRGQPGSLQCSQGLAQAAGLNTLYHYRTYHSTSAPR